MNYFFRKLWALKLSRFELIVMFGVKFFSIFVKASIMGFPLYANITPEWRCVPSQINNAFQPETGEIAAEWGQRCSVYYNCSNELTRNGANNKYYFNISNPNDVQTEPHYHLEFRSPFYSARQEFGLVCNHAYQAALMATIQFLGVLIGALSVGQVTDAFGRRYVWATVIAGQMVFSVLSSFSTGSTSLTLLRFMCGLFAGGDYVTGYVYVMEMIKPQQRMFMNAMAGMPAEFILLALYYFTADWRLSLRIVPFGSILSLVLLLFVVPESSKWARDLGKHDVAAKSEARIAWINGKKPNYLPEAEMDSKVDKSQATDGSSNAAALLLAQSNRSLQQKNHTLQVRSPAQRTTSICSDTELAQLGEPSLVGVPMAIMVSQNSLHQPIEMTETEHPAEVLTESVGRISISKFTQEADVQTLQWTKGDLPNGNGVGESDIAVQIDSKRPRITIKSLFATRELRIRTVVMCYLWISVALVSYTVSFDSRNLDGNFYLNQLFRSIGSVGSGILIFAFDTYIPHFSRRVLHQVPQVVIISITATVGILYAAHVEASGRAAITVLALSVSYFLGPVWDAVYLCTAEIFPTEARSTAFSLCNLFARIGVMLAPQVILLRELWPAAPYFLMATVTIGSFIISYKFLPDTKDKALPGNVQEASQSLRKRTITG